MKKPVVMINLKTYKVGKDVLKLSKTIQSVDKKIIIGAQASDIHVLYSSISNPVFAQHVDAVDTGRNTGFITPESVYAVGAKGAFINHSEHRLDMKTIKLTVKRCKQIGLQTAVFAKDVAQAKKIRTLKPDYLIVEPPELVSKKSISKHNPGLIKRLAKQLNYPFLVGAGIKDHTDVNVAMTLGSKGIALSSAVTKAKNPKKVLKDLLG